MRARRIFALPAVAALAVALGLAVGGCGGSSSGESTATEAQNAAATGKGGEAMKHDEGSMKHGESMHDEGMKKEEHGSMKHGESMHDEGGSMKHGEG